MRPHGGVAPESGTAEHGDQRGLVAQFGGGPAFVPAATGRMPNGPGPAVLTPPGPRRVRSFGKMYSVRAMPGPEVARGESAPGDRRRPISRTWLGHTSLEVAPTLLGAVLVSTTPEGTVAVRLTEVEAYEGADDPGSHAYRGRTPRNEVMFGRAGHLYVYFTYGMHWCANVVCGPAGRASAVLLRAGEVVEGLATARARRPSARADRDLARGPARLASVLGIDRTYNGLDLCDRDSPLVLVPAGDSPKSISTGPRVGLAQGADRPWRFWLAGEPTVSPYRPHVPRRRSSL